MLLCSLRQLNSFVSSETAVLIQELKGPDASYVFGLVGFALVPAPLHHTIAAVCIFPTPPSETSVGRANCVHVLRVAPPHAGDASVGPSRQCDNHVENKGIDTVHVSIVYFSTVIRIRFLFCIAQSRTKLHPPVWTDLA
jgi:hypothetical protein